MLSALLGHIMRLSVPREGMEVDVSIRFLDFELGCIEVLNVLLCHIFRFSIPRGGWGGSPHQIFKF